MITLRRRAHGSVSVMTRLASLFAVLPLLACTATKNSDTPGSSGSGGTPPPAAGATKSLSCLAIFDCASACADGDDACNSACLASGSDASQAATLALVKCFNDHACADSACLKTNCQAEVDACVADGQPKGTPLPAGGAQPGSVPANLVGSWIHAAYGEDNRLKFDAAGTGFYQLSVTSTESCAITNETIWDGTVVIDATTIAVYATTVTNSSFTCGSKSETTSPPETLHFTYTFDAGADVLTAIDSDCAAKYPDSPSSQELYCQNAYTRE